jgi:hypothetical protein
MHVNGLGPQYVNMQIDTFQAMLYTCTQGLGFSVDTGPRLHMSGSWVFYGNVFRTCTFRLAGLARGIYNGRS